MKFTFKVAGSMLSICGLLFVSGEAAIAGIQDVRTLIRNNDGSFLAVCRNGDTETTSAYEIREGWVCEDGDHGSDSPTTPTGQWRPLANTNISVEKMRLGDFNDDGEEDVLTIFNGHFQVSYSGTERWTALAQTNLPIERIRLGDFDGDGTTDIFSVFDNSFQVMRFRAPWRKKPTLTPKKGSVNICY